MKKVLFIGILAAMFLGLVNAQAMTESELRKRFDETITIGDVTLSVSAGDKKAVDDYLAKYELSESDCDTISGLIDEAKKIIKAEGKTNFKDFSESSKTKLKNLVAEVSANTSVKATVTEGALVVLNEEGKTFYEATSLVKQTSAESSNIAIIAGLAFIKSGFETVHSA